MRIPRPQTPTAIWLLLLVCALPSLCIAMWAMPNSAPVGRLVANLTAYTKEHPDDAEGFYLLGRVHGLAFVKRQRSISTWDRRERQDAKPLPNIANDDFQFDDSWLDRDNPKPAPTSEELAHHMSEAVKSFSRAIELDKKPPHYHLGFAYVLELGASMAEKAETVPGATPLDKITPDKRKQLEEQIAKLSAETESTRAAAKKALRADLPTAATLLHAHRNDESPAMKEAVHELLAEHWREQAIAHYYQGYIDSITEESKITEKPMRGLQTLVSYEAGKAYIKLMLARGAVTQQDKDRLAQAQKDIDQLDNKPDNFAITPIIFSLDSPAPLASLLDPTRTVFFDLDGDGTPEPRPWLMPGTALLVWDPDRTGVITSGRQLFGSVTWWFFFSDGYRALDALDDNRDAQLTGPELLDLAVWTDLNADAVSDPGEVIPIEYTTITAISTRATSRELDCPANHLGLTLADGRTLPTYDWIADTAKPAPHAEFAASTVTVSAAPRTPITPRPHVPEPPDLPAALLATPNRTSRSARTI